jgi:hypothetical protein
MPKSRVSRAKQLTKSAETDTPAVIAFKITAFNPVLVDDCEKPRSRSIPGGASQAVMRVVKKNPRVRIDPERQLISVNAPGAILQFVVEPNLYLPIGISFWMLPTDAKVGAEQKAGLVDFEDPQIQRRGRTISINDRFKSGGPYFIYKFSMVIQRLSDGKLGIVDPGIENEP